MWENHCIFDDVVRAGLEAVEPAEFRKSEMSRQKQKICREKQSPAFCLSGYLDNRAEGFQISVRRGMEAKELFNFLISEKGFAKIPTEKKTLYMELNVENKKEAVVRKEIQNILKEENKRRRNVSATGVEDQSGEAGIFCISKSELLENAKDDIQGNRINFWKYQYCAADGRSDELLKYRGYRNLFQKKGTGDHGKRGDDETAEAYAFHDGRRILFLCGDSSACDNWKCHVTMDQNVYGNKTFVFCISIIRGSGWLSACVVWQESVLRFPQDCICLKKVTVNNNKKGRRIYMLRELITE